MGKKLFWTKNMLDKEMSITNEQSEIGKINWSNFLSSEAVATFQGHGFILNRNFFLLKSDVLDINTRAVLGSIVMSIFNPRNTVVINRKCFILEINNLWQSRWTWKFNDREIIVFQTHDFLMKNKGTIEVSASDCEELEILILLGLMVRNQFFFYIIIIALFLLLIMI